jgi:hypothetical protein
MLEGNFVFYFLFSISGIGSFPDLVEGYNFNPEVKKLVMLSQEQQRKQQPQLGGCERSHTMSARWVGGGVNGPYSFSHAYPKG